MKKVLIIVMALMMTVGSVSAASKPAKPTIKVSHKSTKVTVKWNKAKNAKKYEVYVKAGKAKWKKAKTTTSKKYTKNISYNKRYYFKVRGVNGKTKGAFSKRKSIIVKTPKSVTFHGETFKIVNSESYYDKNGEKEWWGETTDGLYAHYYEKNGKINFLIAPGDEYGNKLPDMLRAKGQVDIGSQNISWGFDEPNMSMSFTLDETNPTKGIGNVTGKTYFNYDELSGRFSTGKLKRYKTETITKGSYTKDGQFNFGALLQPGGLLEEYYQPASETNLGGCHVILDNGKTYWQGYSKGKTYRKDYVSTSVPLKVWARVYKGTKRVSERYVDIVPDLN